MLAEKWIENRASGCQLVLVRGTGIVGSGLMCCATTLVPSFYLFDFCFSEKVTVVIDNCSDR